MAINQKTNSFFRHFGEELVVGIGGNPPATATGIFNDATTSFTPDDRADVITTQPHVILMAAEVQGIGINDTVTRGGKTYYVVSWVGDAEVVTVYLSEDRG